MTPDGARELTSAGHRVLVEMAAGARASFADADYSAAGAETVDAASAWEADLVVKVKEPQRDEFGHLRADLVLFTYLHLAAYPHVATALLEHGVAGIAYETVSHDGRLPLLTPMSEIAGRLATQIGAHFLESVHGGRGVLLGGATGVPPGEVVVVGAGTVGSEAAVIAAGMRASVQVFDTNVERLRAIEALGQGRITTNLSSRAAVARAVKHADLVVGAVLLAGDRAPVVVDDDMIRTMHPGSVIVDVAIDQGGCVEGIRETTHREPVYAVHDVLHYGVGNIPGVVPSTSTRALTGATLPFVMEIANHGLPAALRRDPMLRSGLNTFSGAIVHETVAGALHRPIADLDALLPAVA